MDITYTMIGADGLQYGPITLEQLKSWVTEGRVTGDTKILRSDTQSWLPAANYTELGLAQTVATPVPIAPPLSNPVNPAPAARFDPVMVRRFYRGARWFYWIAGLSVVNTVLLQSRTGFIFLFGLGITQAIPNPVVDVAIAGFFALLGVFALKGQSWSFILGIILYTGDALLMLLVQDWLGLAFHAYVLFWLVMGLTANLKLKSQLR